jgi:TonB family protein
MINWMLLLTLGLLPPLSAFAQDPAGPGAGEEIATALRMQEKGAAPADITQVDREPVLKKRADPRYPDVARKAGIEGKVWVKLWIGTDGKVADAQLIKTDHEALVEASLDAARKFEFEPAIMKGKPTAVWVTVPFAFKLADKSGPQEPGYRLLETVTKILQGSQLDSCKRAIDPSAYLVNGSDLIHLPAALDRWGEKGGFPDEKGRTVGFVRGQGSPSGDVFTLTVKTEVKKGSEPRFHTVVWTRSAGGEWRITQWHASR